MNTIRKYFPFLLLAAFLLLLLGNCKERLRPPCPPPGEDYVDSNHYWLFRHHVGDSLTFNVYRVEILGNHHVYHFLREETFVGVDSGEVVEYDDWDAVQHEDGCWVGDYNRHNLCITFKSDRGDVMKYMIYAFGYPFDDLKILFKENDFGVSHYAFNYPQYPEYEIEGEKYQDVIWSRGFENIHHIEQYVDSTGFFINYKDGLLKFIINDTLAYLRKQ